MESPLQPRSEAALNATSELASETSETTYSKPETADAENSQSSPFHANNTSMSCESIPEGPVEHVNSTPTSPNPLAASTQSLTVPEAPPVETSLKPRPLSMNSPRRTSPFPARRFPVKVTSPVPSLPPSSPPKQAQSFDDVLRDNEGLTQAIRIFEDEKTVKELLREDDKFEIDFDDTIVTQDGDNGYTGMDDTAFSAFSAIPEMTMFAKLGRSPPKHSAPSSSKSFYATPGSVRSSYHSNRSSSPGDRSASPTPRRDHYQYQGSEDTTNLLLDFTEQFHRRRSPEKSHRQSPSRGRNSVLSTPSTARGSTYMTSATKRMSNLLDFDMSPAPTPRSLPTITPRELESLKSSFLSEISSLKASLSGREAEVLSLKTAIGDAEKRVGESLEQLREESQAREQLAYEKEDWEKRCKNMDGILREVKSEVVNMQQERDELEGRIEESEKRREAAELIAQQAESRMATMRSSSNRSSSGGEMSESVRSDASNSREIDLAVERVSRELHTLYKGKHETKVAALKKSYEARWERKLKELEGKVDELRRENDELRSARDATLSTIVPKMSDDQADSLRIQAAEDAKTNKELEARIEGLAEEMNSLKRDNDQLRHELDTERVEKGELVAAVEEMISLQSSMPPPPPPTVPESPARQLSGTDKRSSLTRPSGLRAPAASRPSGIGRPRPESMGSSRTGSAQSGRPGSGLGMRPGSGLSTRSGIMSSIEKMGAYKGRGGE